MSPDKYHVAWVIAWTGYNTRANTWTDLICDFSLT